MKKNPFRTILNISAITVFFLALGMVFAYNAARAWNGPSQAPSGGYGSLGSDGSNDISVGTSSPVSGTKLTVAGATSDNTTNALKVFESNGTPVFILRDDGSVAIATTSVTTGSTVIGNNLVVNGTFTANGLSGTLTAGNVSAGQFGSNTGGGNYSFPGNLGVGTVSPTGKFEVVGGPVLLSNTVAGAGDTYFSGNSINGQYSTNANGIFYINYTGYQAGTTQFRDTQISNGKAGSILFAQGSTGNVGIGTTAPGQLLDVNGNINVAGTAGYYIGENPVLIPSGGSTYIRPPGSTGNDYFQAYGGSILLTALNGGNVGIATTTPAYKLDVAGAASFEGNQIHNVGTPTASTDAANKSYVDSVVSGGSGPWTVSGSNLYTSSSSYNVGIGTASPAGNFQVNNSSGNVNVGFTSSATNYSSALYLLGQGTGSGYLAYSNALYFGTASGVGGAITYQGIINGSGDLGIGTTSPGYKLEVNGNAKFDTGNGLTINTSASTPTSGSGAIELSGANGLVLQGNGGTYDMAFNDFSGSTFLENPDNTANAIFPGKVGIDTTSPGYALDVNGTGNFEGYQIHNVGTPTAASDAATKSYVDSAVAGGSSGGSFATLTVSGQSSFGGAPYYLTSSNNGGAANVYYQMPPWGGFVDWQFGSGSGYWNAVSINSGTPGGSSSYGSGQLNVYSNNSVTTSINGTGNSYFDGGNVGIGTTSPLSIANNTELSLYGTWYSGVDLGGNGTSDIMRLSTDGSGNSYIYDNHTGSSLYLGTNSSTVMTILSSGNVGIGTASPGYTLTVSGTSDFTQPVIVGTPTTGADAATKSYVDSAVTGGSGGGSFATLTVTGNWTISGAAQGNLNLNGYNITGVNKLSVTTIDPLYQIGGVDYATFAPGEIGVNEEVDGDATLAKAGSDYEYAINFAKLAQGSDLWVWYQAVDFGKDTVNAIATPYGQFAEIYYTISGSTLTFHGNAPAEFSYRLTGKRFDWQQWPTRAADQSQTPGLVVPVKD